MPQPVGKGGVDVQGFLGDAFPFLLGQRVEGLHVVEPVGQFDQHDADVLGHRHQHLAQAFRVELLLLVRRVLARPRLLETHVHPGELGHSVHQQGDFIAKPVDEVFEGDAAVFDYVVEEGGADGVNIEVEVGQEEGGLERVGDIRLAGQPLLPFMALPGEVIGPPDRLDGVFGEIAGNPVNQDTGVGRGYH